MGRLLAARVKGRELGQQRGPKDVLSAGDAHRAGRLVPHLGQLIQLRINLVEAVAQWH